MQGLGGPQYKRLRGRLRLELQKVLIGNCIDILFLQEHHLCKRRTDNYGSILPGYWLTYWSPGVGNNGSQAGVCIAFAEKWKTNIIRYEELVPGKAQCIILDIGKENVAFLNIYAPNSASQRILFWKQLLRTLPSLDNWCVGGDFNMVEDPCDRVGGRLTIIHGQELAEWENLIFKWTY